MCVYATVQSTIIVNKINPIYFIDDRGKKQENNLETENNKVKKNLSSLEIINNNVFFIKLKQKGSAIGESFGQQKKCH